MTTLDKILLVANGAFTILSLIFILYMPQNTLFTLSNWAKIAFYAASAACFFIYVKKRGNLKTALALTWLNCAVFVVCTALIILANWYK